VLDASVVLGWLLREPLPEALARLLDDHVAGRVPAVAPELLRYEVGNVLARGASLDAAAARSGYERFLALEIQTFALGDDEYRAALDLALNRGVTVYDASYVALARALGARFATADRQLAARLADPESVELISRSGVSGRA
jgi:predicted nucleic acid-binding protein